MSRLIAVVLFSCLGVLAARRAHADTIDQFTVINSPNSGSGVSRQVFSLPASPTPTSYADGTNGEGYISFSNVAVSNISKTGVAFDDQEMVVFLLSAADGEFYTDRTELIPDRVLFTFTGSVANPTFLPGVYYDGGGEEQLTIATVTPEPSSFVLLGTGVLGVAGVVRRRLGVSR